jgi:hypothetical protein
MNEQASPTYHGNYYYWLHRVKGYSVDNGNPEPEPSGQNQYRDTKVAAATAASSHSIETYPVNE